MQFPLLNMIRNIKSLKVLKESSSRCYAEASRSFVLVNFTPFYLEQSPLKVAHDFYKRSSVILPADLADSFTLNSVF